MKAQLFRCKIQGVRRWLLEAAEEVAYWIAGGLIGFTAAPLVIAAAAWLAADLEPVASGVVRSAGAAAEWCRQFVR